jgi:adenosylmethionine-8-amino-7-oxononanoate aminotransferase
VVSSLLQHFARNAGAPLVLTRGDGVHVWDDRGRRHVDGLSALYCAQLGYGYGAEFAEAAAAQMTTLPFATNWGVAHPPALALADALAERTGLRHAFFTGGGSEAVEAAWKLVRQIHLARGEPQRTKVVARRIAVPRGHPRRARPDRRRVDEGAVRAAADRRPPGGDDERVPARGPRPARGRRAAVHEAGADEVAMVIAEPVQNAGGCLTAPRVLAGLRELCDRTGALLVADEVICGFGRLGAWLGTQRYGVTPDLATVAKGITSAYAPMGAVLVREQVAAPLFDAGGRSCTASRSAATRSAPRSP